MQALSHLNWRAAVKEYDAAKQLSEEHVNLLIEAARLAPTSYGLQPLKLIVVSDSAVKTKLRDAAYGQSQLTDASHIFVFAVKKTLTEADVKEYVGRIIKTRGITHDSIKGYEEMMLGTVKGLTQPELQAWNARQAYLALGVVIDVAAANQIDTTPMEGFDNAKVDQILGLVDQGLTSAVILSAGFRVANETYSQAAKVRLTVEQFVTRV